MQQELQTTALFCIENIHMKYDTENTQKTMKKNSGKLAT